VRASALFGEKNFGFFEIYGVSAWTWGVRVEPVRTFFGQGGGGQFFADVLYGRPLTCTESYTRAREGLMFKIE